MIADSPSADPVGGQRRTGRAHRLVNLVSGEVVNRTNGQTLAGEPLPTSSPPMQMLRAEGMKPYPKRWIRDNPDKLRHCDRAGEVVRA